MQHLNHLVSDVTEEEVGIGGGVALQLFVSRIVLILVCTLTMNCKSFLNVTV